jgi:hypothetical protein
METRRISTVSPYILEGSTGDTTKKDFKKYTFKAGMCMKTNKTRTKCPKKVGHLRQTDTRFAENRALVTTICRFNLLFCGFFRA